MAKSFFALPFLTCCLICSSLVTFSYFGNVSLTAYFGFCIASIIGSVTVCFQVLRNINAVELTNSFKNTIGPSSIFLLLCLYALSHGFVNHNFNLTNYYWLAAAALVLSLNGIVIIDNKGDILKTYLTYLHPGIIMIAVIESIVVILQWFGLCPSMNELFASTGTWANPNVTAMFLALSLFSQSQFINRPNPKVVFRVELFVILLAIALLQCRTAYVVTAILLLDLFKHAIPYSKLVAVRILAIGLIIFFLSFGYKTNSTTGRIQIWKNSVALIATEPLTGFGFGQFEKAYNSFVAEHNLPSVDHVNMAYNDFLELAVEGGIIAVALWVGFLGFLLWRFKSDSSMLSLIISFILIQVTNFGFQAIPAFALFLIYTQSYVPRKEKSENLKRTLEVKPAFKLVLTVLLTCEIILGVRMISIANAFHESKLNTQEYPPPEARERSETLATTLNFSSSYHESMGDLFMQSRNWRAGMLQYRWAAQTTSNPNVLGKCGWSYAQLKQFDSAAYYFELIEKLQPYKYAPRVALLKLYEQKKDTVSIKLKAREIMSMPVKVPGADIDKIKQEAGRWLVTNF